MSTEGELPRLYQRLAAAALVGGLICLVPAYDLFEDMVGGLELFVAWFVPGVALGTAIALTRLRSPAARRARMTERIAWVACVALGLGFLAASAAAFYNSRGDQAPDRLVELEVVQKRTGKGRRGRITYHVSVVWRGREENLTPGRAAWHEIHESRPLRVCVAPGALGHPFVRRFPLATDPGCTPQAPPRLETFDTRFADVYLVPIGPFAPAYLASLATYYEHVFGLRVGVTAPLPPSPDLYDEAREQLVTQRVLASMQSRFETYSYKPGSIFVGVTHADMYIAGSDWRYAYAHRLPRRFAVVSSAHMGAFWWWRAPLEVEQVDLGLRKMVTKAIGVLYYRQPLNSDPESVLYDGVRGSRDLDRIDEATLHDDILGRPG